MTNITISQITPSGWNKRGDEAYQDEAFQELKKSIQEHGFWQHKPLLVREYKEGIGYQLLGGHRRLRAAQELGLESVPAIIEVCGDIQAKRMVFLDNFHHKDLEPLEEAEAIQDLLADGMTQEALAKDVGKSQSWIANRLRLLKAPDELKELIISREITAKHIMALLPYAEYPVFKEKIMPEIERVRQYSGDVSVRQVENIIESGITGDYDGAAVLQLNDFPYRVDQYREFFDFTGCQECKGVFVQKEEYDPEDIDEGEEPPEDNRYCMDRRCWSDRVNIAKQKYEKAHAQKVKTSKGNDTVDLNALKYDEYERIGKWAKWDRTECQTCESKKMPSDQDELRSCEFVCVDPSCAKGKEAAQRKEELKLAREEAKKAFEMLDAYIAEKPTISDSEVRGLIKILVRHLWGDSIRNALKPWTSKAGKWNEDEVDKIPDDDVVKALLRLVFVQDLTAHNYDGVNTKAVEKVIAVFEGKSLPKEN